MYFSTNTSHISSPGKRDWHVSSFRSVLQPVQSRMPSALSPLLQSEYSKVTSPWLSKLRMGSLHPGEEEIYISITPNSRNPQVSISPLTSSCERCQAVLLAAVLCTGPITALRMLRAFLTAGHLPRTGGLGTVLTSHWTAVEWKQHFGA